MASLEIWWLGQAGFRLRALNSGPTVFVDPFVTRMWGRSWQAPIGPRELAAADAILITHEHIDHFDRPSLRTAAAIPDARFTLVVPRPLVAEAQGLGVPPDRIVGLQPDDAVDIAGVRVFAEPALHGVHVADAYSFGEALSEGLVRYLGYVVDLGGVRVYHSGDCLPFPGQVERLRALAPEVALLPINGRGVVRERLLDIVGNMDERQAAQLANDIGARVLVPMHWELFAFNQGSPQRLEAHAARAFPSLTVDVPTRGGRLTYASSSNSRVAYL